MKSFLSCYFIVFSFLFISLVHANTIDFSKRPIDLIQKLKPSALKDRLLSCQGQPIEKTSFSIGHRGAPLKFPEHTTESYYAAAKMGAGIMECDVAFTKDKVLVCRHSQGDLHYTTNILETPLAEKCSVPFQPAAAGAPVKVQCLTSDLTVEEFKSLRGRHGKVNTTARTIAEYLENHSGNGELLTHSESIALFKTFNVKFIPELKRPLIQMPYAGFTKEDYAQKFIDAYKSVGIAPEDVFVQSFRWEDILYWLENEPDFGKQAIYLDGRFNNDNFDPLVPETYSPSMEELKISGLNYIAPPLWMLVQAKDGEIVPSPYAIAAKAAGLEIIAWTVERSGSLKNGGGWYYQTINDLITHDGQVFELLDVFAKEIGVQGVFSDWPATTTYYANCMGIK